MLLFGKWDYGLGKGNWDYFLRRNLGIGIDEWTDSSPARRLKDLGKFFYERCSK